jgi:hypothetical protein
MIDPNGTETPVLRLRRFLLPGGEEAAQGVRSVTLKEEGEMRSAPEARWVPFTAEERIDARQSAFAWEARFRSARIVPMTVVDAYENRQGRLVVRIGGAVPAFSCRGGDFDRGELQRYLSSAALCPPLLVRNGSLVWVQVDERTLRVGDTGDPTGATVEYDIGDDGRPLCCRADRPRLVGKRTVPTPWLAATLDFREMEGLRVATRLEAAWHLPEGAFTYFRSEVTSVVLEP